jgi:haloalkane dehalogenase
LVSKDIYPFEGKYLALDQHRMHYLDEGAGDPVVMVHGNPTWSIYYRNLVMALRDTHRCIVPDHIGCGYSDKPQDDTYDYTLSQRVADLETLLEDLGVTENITLVVHDWGGMIGMTYATRHPERIKRLVVLNTSAFHLPDTKPFPWPLWIVRNTPVGAFLVRGFNAFAGIAARVCCTRNRMSKDLRRAYCAPYNSWQNRIATLRFVQDIPLRPGDRSYDIVSSVEENVGALRDKPILICWGLKDFVFDAHFLRKWEEAFPNAEVHRFEDCGHYILEDASEEVVGLVQAFVNDRYATESA